VMATAHRRTQLINVTPQGSVQSQVFDIMTPSGSSDLRGYAVPSRGAVWLTRTPLGSRLTLAEVELVGGVITGYGLKRIDLSTKGGKLVATEVAHYAGPRRGTDGVWIKGSPWLDWFARSPATGDLLDLGGDTLVVVCVPQAGGSDPAYGGVPPGDQLRVYWLHGADGSVLDSATVLRKDVAGRDFVGPLIPRGVLAATRGGYEFAIATATGVSTYTMDRGCRPVRGPRSQSAASGSDCYVGRGSASVFCAMRTSETNPGVRLWSAFWYALGEGGELYYDRSLADGSLDRQK
jgi:hypothetical protein